MKWTEEKLNRLAEINKMKKIPRYFAIKNWIDAMIPNCMICSDSGFVRQKSAKFPIIKCPFCKDNLPTSPSLSS